MKKLILIILFVISLASAVYSIPVAVWHFDECNGTTAFDSTGNGNTGTVINGLQYAWTNITPFGLGCALPFDGYDDYIATVHTSSIDLTTQVKLEAWVKRNSNADGTIISKNGPYYLGVIDNKVNGRIYANNGNCPTSCTTPGANTWTFVSGTTDLQLGVWYKLKMTYDGSFVRVYVNDILEGSAPKTGQMPIVSQIVTIGWGEPGVNFFFNGSIDEVKIDNNATFTPPTQNPLVAHWRLDEGSGNTAFDSSNNNNHGALQNGANWVNNSFSGYAVQFDGINDHIAVADSPTLDIIGNISIQAWIYPTEIPSYPYPTIVGKWGGNNQRSYALHLGPDGRLYFRVSPNGQELGLGVGSVISNAQIPLNQWTHVVGVYDSSAVKVYINGELDNSVSYNQGIFAGDAALGIGAVIDPNIIGPFKGIIDEVKIYNQPIIDNITSPPSFNLLPIGNRTITEGQQLNIQLQIENANPNTTLIFNTNAASILLSPFSFNQNTGLFQWTPTYTDYGNYTITFNVTDGLLTDEETVQININDAQTAVLAAIGLPNPGSEVDLFLSDIVAPNKPYILAMSISNNPPLILSDARIIPLTPDGGFIISVFAPNLLGLSNAHGLFNNAGNAIATWTIPNYVPSGLTFYFAFISIELGLPFPQGIISISNGASLTIV